MIDLYHKLVADEAFLNVTDYPDPLDNHTAGGACISSTQKRSHLAAFFNELTAKNGSVVYNVITGGSNWADPASKLIDTGRSDISNFASRYAGMSPDYKSELLYKMKEAALEILKKMEATSTGSDVAAASSTEETKRVEEDKKGRIFKISASSSAFFFVTIMAPGRVLGQIYVPIKMCYIRKYYK